MEWIHEQPAIMIIVTILFGIGCYSGGQHRYKKVNGLLDHLDPRIRIVRALALSILMVIPFIIIISPFLPK